MSTIEFEAWPKIARLNRNCVVSEKLDGTNACVVVVPLDEHVDLQNVVIAVLGYAVYAQSRTRFITPENDNYGFARWVRENAEALVDTLGPGRHYGEWWGAGIQRKYGLTGNDKRFSLFNTGVHDADDLAGLVPGLGVVPVLYSGPFDTGTVNDVVEELRATGSQAVPGFMRPEGVVVYHEALRSSFKITLEGDAAPKGAAGHALDVEDLKVAA